jgi:hypothetical protein
MCPPERARRFTTKEAGACAATLASAIRSREISLTQIFNQLVRTVALRSLRYSRDCFDLKGAERFRLLADDLLGSRA